MDIGDRVSQSAIDAVAEHLNQRNNKPYNISIISILDNTQSPQYFEIIPFEQLDNADWRVYAIDGSQNSHTFYNGLSIGLYRGGYVCFQSGKQIRVNDNDDPILLGKAYSPENILITSEDHLYAIYDELLELQPVKTFLKFLDDNPENIFPYSRDTLVAASLSALLSFCQEILEWSLIYEIACRSEIRENDLILRDGTLRSLNIKQEYLVKLGRFLSSKKIVLAGITKNSPVKMELNYTFRQIDNYLQEQLKTQYPFKQTDPRRQKLCCWFEDRKSVV